MLDSDAAIDVFRAKMDSEFSGYEGDNDSPPVITEQDAIDMWAEAMEALVTAIQPVSTTVSAAVDAFRSAAIGMSLNNAAIISALNSMCSTLGGGMVGYTAVPPVFSPADLMLASPAISAEIGITELVGKIKTKLETGTATLQVPPFTVETWR